MSAVREISYRRGRVICAERIDYDELYLHALRQYALYIYARVVAVFHSVAVFRKPREVRSQLDEYAVFLDRADDSGNRFAGFERGGVLFPCAEQFSVRERNAPQFVAAFDYCADVLSRRKPRVRVRNARYGDAVDGQQRAYPRADVAECAERLHVRDAGVDNIAADERREIFPAAVLLHAAAAEDGICFALLIRVEPGYAENNRLVHPRDQRDIAHAPVLDSERALVFRYYAAHAAEVNMEIVLAVAQHGSALERSPAFACLPEQCRRAEYPGVLRRRQQCSLGFEAGHCLFSPFAAPRFGGEPIVLKICGILRPQCTKCENNVIIIYSPIKEEEQWMSEWATSSS